MAAAFLEIRGMRAFDGARASDMQTQKAIVNKANERSIRSMNTSIPRYSF